MTVEEKQCTKCKIKKPFNQFYKNKAAKDGYQYNCKDCQKKYWQSENGKRAARRYWKSEKGKVTNNRYEKSQKGRVKDKRYAQSEKGKLAVKKYTQSIKFKNNCKRYTTSEKGRQVLRKNSAIRRTRKTQAGGSYSQDEWYNLCKFYDFHCLKCEKQFPFNQLTVDHIKPVVKGGVTFIWNLQPLCSRCNKKKSYKEIDYRQTLPDWIKRDRSIWIQDTLF